LSTPSAPSLSSPSNGSSTCDNTPTFNWSSVSGAVSYDIQVSTSSSFSSLEINQTTSNTSYTPPTPLSAGTHYWRVRTNAACGSGDWSSIWSVTIMEIPSPPTLSSPPNGSNTCDTTPTVCWSSVTGATSYRLQVSSSSAFGSPIIDESGLSSTCYTPSSALSPGTYYWRVNGANTCGTSAWSSAGNFAVIAIPAPPTLSSPADNGQVADRTPTFRWNAATWASSYRIQVSTSSSFATLLADQTTSDTSYTAVSEFSLGTYYWRVRASNACGTGSWSPTRSFEVIEAFEIFLPAVMKNY